MTKKLHMTIINDLPDDVFQHAEAVLASKKVLDAVHACVAEHLPLATVSHEIIDPAATAPVKIKRARKSKTVTAVEPKKSEDAESSPVTAHPRKNKAA